MIEPDIFVGTRLFGGCSIVELGIARELPADGLGRESLGWSWVTGQNIHVTIRAGLSDREFSVTLYHEILEVMTLAVDNPPESVWQLNEGDYERAGYEAHERFGPASPENLNSMLQFYGFGEP